MSEECTGGGRRPTVMATKAVMSNNNNGYIPSRTYHHQHSHPVYYSLCHLSRSNDLMSLIDEL